MNLPQRSPLVIERTNSNDIFTIHANFAKSILLQTHPALGELLNVSSSYVKRIRGIRILWSIRFVCFYFIKQVSGTETDDLISPT